MLEIGERHGAAERIAGIRMAVKESFVLFIFAEERRKNFFRGSKSPRAADNRR